MLNGAKYGKAIIHKSIKQQLIYVVLMVADRLQFKFRRSLLKGFKSVYSDNSYLPWLETLHFDEIIAQC